MDQSITWTPEGSEDYLGSVKLAPGLKSLTLGSYKMALADQIDRLVRQSQASGQDPLALIEQPMWNNDKLTPPSNPSEIGTLMAEHSETLHNRAIGEQTFPANPPFKMDSLAAVALRNRTLEEFVNSLYQ